MFQSIALTHNPSSLPLKSAESQKPTAQPPYRSRVRRLNAARWRQEAALIAFFVMLGGLAFMTLANLGWAMAVAVGAYNLSLVYRLMRVASGARRQRGHAVYGLPGLIQDRQRRIRLAWGRRQRKLVELLKRYHHSAMSVPDAMVVLTPLREIEW
ncbi:MAG: hypothetical protein B7Z82_04900, partial [Halothiobacillus sp. 20-54-6]